MEMCVEGGSRWWCWERVGIIGHGVIGRGVIDRGGD